MYWWWRPPTFGIAFTVPISGGSTGLETGASLWSDK